MAGLAHSPTPPWVWFGYGREWELRGNGGEWREWIRGMVMPLLLVRRRIRYDEARAQPLTAAKG